MTQDERVALAPGPWPDLPPGVREPTDAAEPLAVLREYMGLMHRQRQLLRRSFARAEMHPGQAQCLRMLWWHGDGVNQSELAEAMMLSRPSVTRILQRMERAGLVWRRTDPADQRQTLVGLTDAGRARNERITAVLAEYTGATLARLPEEDRRRLAELLRAWRELADELLARPDDPSDHPLDDPLDDLPDDPPGPPTGSPRGPAR